MKPHFRQQTADPRLTPVQRIRLHGCKELLSARGLVSAIAHCAAAVLVVAAWAEDLSAQKKGERVRVLAGSAMRAAPGGQVVGVLSRVYEAPVEMVQGSAVRLKLNGFVAENDVRIERNGARGVMGGTGGRSDDGGTLRTGRGEKEPALAALQRGAVVFPGQKASSYFAVNRTVWVDKSRLAKFTGPATEKPAARTPAKEPVAQNAPKPAGAPAPQKPLPAPAQPVAATVQSNGASPSSAQDGRARPQMQTAGAGTLRSAPNGTGLFPIPPGTIVTPLNSDAGWTRVRVEGWVPTADLADLDQKGATGITAADLRADPDGMKGRIVRWTVENLSYQLGDGLRRELNGAPYLLARGPGNERAILYLVIPDSLVTAARALAPLSTVTVTAKVRSGKSEPGGVPILDILELVRR